MLKGVCQNYCCQDDLGAPDPELHWAQSISRLAFFFWGNGLKPAVGHVGRLPAVRQRWPRLPAAHGCLIRRRTASIGSCQSYKLLASLAKGFWNFLKPHRALGQVLPPKAVDNTFTWVVLILTAEGCEGMQSWRSRRRKPSVSRRALSRNR